MDPLIRHLTELPEAQPDAGRAERLRMKCRTQLAARAVRAADERAPVLRGDTVRIWQPLVAALGVLYMVTVIVQALGAYRLL